MDTIQTLDKPGWVEPNPGKKTAAAGRGVLLAYSYYRRDNRAYHNWEDWVREFDRVGVGVSWVVATHLDKIEVFERTVSGDYNQTGEFDNDLRLIRLNRTLEHVQYIAGVLRPQTTYEIVIDVCVPHTLSQVDRFVILEAVNRLAKAGHRIHTLVSHHYPDPDFGEQLAVNGRYERYQQSSLFDSIERLVAAGFGP